MLLAIAITWQVLFSLLCITFRSLLGDAAFSGSQAEMKRVDLSVGKVERGGGRNQQTIPQASICLNR